MSNDNDCSDFILEFEKILRSIQHEENPYVRIPIVPICSNQVRQTLTKHGFSVFYQVQGNETKVLLSKKTKTSYLYWLDFCTF